MNIYPVWGDVYKTDIYANKGYFGASVKKLITNKFFTQKYNVR